MSCAEIDVEKILSSPARIYPASYTQKDLILYALGIGETRHQFAYEQDKNFAVFPLYPVVLHFKGEQNGIVPFPPPALLEGLPCINPSLILHGEQLLENFLPLQNQASSLRCECKTISISNKGKRAYIEKEVLLIDENDRVLSRMINGILIQGLVAPTNANGRKPLPKIIIPDKREPDWQRQLPSSVELPMLYRLSGDYNPLHVDPKVARSVKLEKPILHGLCMMGIACRALYDQFCNQNPNNFKSVRVRFVSPGYAGDNFNVQMWHESSDNHIATVLFRVIAVDRRVVVLDGGCFKYNVHAYAKL